MTSGIRHIKLPIIDEDSFKHRYVGCLVLTQSNEILLQQRGIDWERYPAYLCEFGGRIEFAETPEQALIRELQEELGAKVKESDIISLGAITEETSNHSELIYTYFWHDKNGTITGCYEGTAKRFQSAHDALAQEKLMDSAHWLITQCLDKKYLTDLRKL